MDSFVTSLCTVLLSHTTFLSLHKKKYFLKTFEKFSQLVQQPAQHLSPPPPSSPGVGDVKDDYQDKTQTSFFRIQEIA